MRALVSAQNREHAIMRMYEEHVAKKKERRKEDEKENDEGRGVKFFLILLV